MGFPTTLTPSLFFPSLISQCLDVVWKGMHFYHVLLAGLLFASTSASQSLALCTQMMQINWWAMAQLFRKMLFEAAY